MRAGGESINALFFLRAYRLDIGWALLLFGFSYAVHDTSLHDIVSCRPPSILSRRSQCEELIPLVPRAVRDLLTRLLLMSVGPLYDECRYVRRTSDRHLHHFLSRVWYRSWGFRRCEAGWHMQERRTLTLDGMYVHT
jgi:hypothetical protein